MKFKKNFLAWITKYELKETGIKNTFETDYDNILKIINYIGKLQKEIVKLPKYLY